MIFWILTPVPPRTGVPFFLVRFLVFGFWGVSTCRRESGRHALPGKGVREQRSYNPSGREGDGCTLVSAGGGGGGGGGAASKTVGLGPGCAWGGLVVRAGVCARGWVGWQGTTGSAVCHGTASCPNMFHPKAVPTWSWGLVRAAGGGPV